MDRVTRDPSNDNARFSFLFRCAQNRGSKLIRDKRRKRGCNRSIKRERCAWVDAIDAFFHRHFIRFFVYAILDMAFKGRKLYTKVSMIFFAKVFISLEKREPLCTFEKVTSGISKSNSRRNDCANICFFTYLKQSNNLVKSIERFSVVVAKDTRRKE